MLHPRNLLAAVLFVTVIGFPLTGWPFGRAAVYAEASQEQRAADVRVRASDPLDGHTVAASNENEEKDREDRRQRQENDSRDDNDDGDDWSPPPPPRQQAAPPPPPPPPDQVARCLQRGDSVTLTLPDGGVTVKVFQDNLAIELARVDPPSVPAPPGGVVGQFIFRLSAAPCGGQPYGTLPGEVNLGVSYRERVVSGRNESKLTLLHLDGQQWAPASKVATDPGSNFVSATVVAPGVYALGQQ